MKVSDIMSGRVVTIGQKEPVIAAARLLKRMNLGALPVTDDSGRLRGILTDRDIVLRCVAAGADPKTLEIREIMSRGVVTASPGADVAEAARLMRGDQVRRLPVVDHGKLVGMVSLADMAAAATWRPPPRRRHLLNLRRAQVPKNLRKIQNRSLQIARAVVLSS
ncbi:MAG: CBS domain-containing protein [Oscillospiraceae bacterium]